MKLSKRCLGHLLKYLLFTLLVITSSQSFAESKTTFYHYDLLGSPVATTDQAGNVLWREEYSPWGEKLLKEDASHDNVRDYTGHVHDKETGLTYMQARYYDPQIGRFMGVDPVGFQEGNTISFNRYGYANNNPFKFTDPNGELPFLVPVVVFLVKEAAAEVASRYTGGLTDVLSARRMAKKGYKASVKALSKDGNNSKNVALKSTKWKNGYRTADGKFASPNGNKGKAGAVAEQKAWDAIKQKKDGWRVIEGNVGVRNSSGKLRYYDGVAISPRGRAIGLEVKSGKARKTPHQKSFDSDVSTSNPATGVGKNDGLEVGGSLEVRF